MENTESVTRKSSSLDNVNLQQENKTQWKSFSLQRGAAPPTEEEAAHAEQVIAMKSSRAEHVGGAGHGEQEDMYGRCTNMRLTSFTDKGAAVPRDPRLIDLSQSAASTGNLGHPPLPSHPPLPHTSAFNTLPAHMSGQQPGHAPQPHPLGLQQTMLASHPAIPGLQKLFMPSVKVGVLRNCAHPLAPGQGDYV